MSTIDPTWNTQLQTITFVTGILSLICIFKGNPYKEALQVFFIRSLAILFNVTTFVNSAVFIVKVNAGSGISGIINDDALDAGKIYSLLSKEYINRGFAVGWFILVSCTGICSLITILFIFLSNLRFDCSNQISFDEDGNSYQRRKIYNIITIVDLILALILCTTTFIIAAATPDPQGSQYKHYGYYVAVMIFFTVTNPSTIFTEICQYNDNFS